MPSKSPRPENLTPIDFEVIEPAMKLLTRYQRVEGKLVARGRGFYPCIVEATFPELRRLRVRFVYRNGRKEVCMIGAGDSGWYHIHSKDGKHYTLPGVYKLEGKRLEAFEALLRLIGSK